MEMAFKNTKKSFVLLISILIIQELNAVNIYVSEIAKNEKRLPTNQLSDQQQQEKQRQQVLQHSQIEETFSSDESARDEDWQRNYNIKEQQQETNEEEDKSYDKVYDVADDIYADNDDEVDYEEDEDEKELNSLSRRKRELSDWLIAPNTRWCGRGNTAEGRYNHLGGASLADKCCRRHDHCRLYISGMTTRYELFNYRPYTLSHCTCDRRFRTCLKMANDEDAKTIGKLFFNMVQTQCFVLHSEKLCLKRAADGTCLSELTKQKASLRANKKF